MDSIGQGSDGLGGGTDGGVTSKAHTRGASMPETPSTMLDLGTALPSFSLPDFNGKTVSDADFKGGKALLVAFICKHCPFVRHIRPEFAKFVREYEAKGLKVVAVMSNSIQ